ncbi:hypothetical protein ACIP5Y_13215 [Nocardia sp. NPDC088792]|uniref:hypothetical protein n=1 Tax=Nocardia sp. NPDC088792 TaxID=3364332 RepID=UPI00380E19F4
MGALATVSQVRATDPAKLLAVATALTDLSAARQTVVSIADAATANGCLVAEDGHVRAPDMGDPTLQSVANDRARTYDVQLIAALAAFDDLDTTQAATLTTAVTRLRDLIARPASGDIRNR